MLGSSREVDCDFPSCKKRFDTTDGARVAAVQNGDIVAFCAEHSAHLISKRVNLRTLQEVWRELGIEVPPSPEELRARAEQELIRSLK
jgi:hypothetical protein